MNQRTKFLVAGMVLVGVGVFGDLSYRRFVEEPANRRERESKRLQAEIAKAEDTLLDTAKASDEIQAFEHLSLPYDQELARARYQDWLLRLVEKAEWKSPSVNAGTAVPVAIRDRTTRKPKEIYKRYGFIVRGHGTLQQATQFLYDFYQGGHLHKIRSLSLTPVASQQQLAIQLTIEALGLSRCDREGELSRQSCQRLAYDRLESYQTIVHRNLFSRDAARALRQVMLTAVTLDRRGIPEAWFSFGTELPTQRIHRGESLAIPPHDVTVIDIQGDIVIMKVDGEMVRLPLGKSIFEMLAKK